MKTKNLVLTGMLTAVLAVLSIIQIPMPSGVPITLQTFAVALCGYVLGQKYGTLATFLYVLIGAIGLPVFSGMKGGIGVLAGPTGGFLFGFIIMALFAGLGTMFKNKIVSIIFGIIGLILCHIIGAIHFSIVASTGIWSSFLLVSIPYLIKDILSVIGAALVAIAVRKGLRNANLITYKQIV